MLGSATVRSAKHSCPMPRFFFDIHDDIDASDDEGRDLPDADAAIAEALKYARELIKISIDETGRIDLRHHIDVRDDSGNIVYIIHFEDAVTVQRGAEVLVRGSIRLAGQG